MVAVAVAGGTGDLGRLIVCEIARTGKHQVYILSRSVHTSSQPSILDIKYSWPTNLVFRNP